MTTFSSFGSTDSIPCLLSSNDALDDLSPSDRELFCQFGEGPVQKPSFPTVLDAFEQMVADHGDLTAATMVLESGELDDKSSISYTELNLKANQLALVLQQQGVTNGDAVCLFIKRSIEMLVGIMAILKVGACYVPQHVGPAPPSQLLNIAEATKTKVVLTIDELEVELPQFPEHISVISIGKTLTETQVPKSQPVLHRPVVASDRCYLIFTSGTTGAPKGVQVTHGNVANVLLTKPMDLGMAPGVRVGQILSIAFDMGAWEILGCLSHGATLLVRHRNIANTVKHADVVISTPTVLGTIDVRQMSHVKTVAVAGEPCPRPLAAKWSKFARFYNSCGPTETTIVNTAKLFDEEAEVLTIGRPTPNNTVYVLDPETLRPCKIGEVGEMWAGGKCVSAGYLNRSDLTADRYLPDPFVRRKGWLMYKTGDLGRWDENGDLEHFGRVDDQVKVRGFRVELDGVSAVAEQAEGVDKAVVLKVGVDLVAFVTPASADVHAVKEVIARKMPYYCVPAQVFSMEELPKTANGKVEKRKLRAVADEAGTKQLADSSDFVKTATALVSDVSWENIGWTAIALVRRIGIFFVGWMW